MPILDPEFEPFTANAIAARRYAPDVLMELARIGFTSTELSEEEKAGVLDGLRVSLAQLVELAELGMAVATRAGNAVH